MPYRLLVRKPSGIFRSNAENIVQLPEAIEDDGEVLEISYTPGEFPIDAAFCDETIRNPAKWHKIYPDVRRIYEGCPSGR
jgi:hypothetical protein